MFDFTVYVQFDVFMPTLLSPAGHAYAQKSRHIRETLQFHATQPQRWGDPAGMASQTGSVTRKPHHHHTQTNSHLHTAWRHNSEMCTYIICLTGLITSGDIYVVATPLLWCRRAAEWNSGTSAGLCWLIDVSSTIKVRLTVMKTLSAGLGDLLKHSLELSRTHRLYDLNVFLKNQHYTAFEFNPWHCFTKNTAVDKQAVCSHWWR